MVSAEERDRRYAALRQMMERAGLDALLLAGNAEAMQRGYIRYVADWRLWGGKGFALVPLHGEAALILGAGSQSYWARQVGLIDDVRPAADAIEEIGKALGSFGLDRARIGVAGMGQVMVYEDVVRLQRRLGQAELVDATRAVDDIMAIKSAEELAGLAETYDAIAAALEVFRINLAPGRSEREVMAAAVQKLAELGCLDGIAHLTTGVKPFLRPPTERRFTTEDIVKVSLEFAGPSGYWIELAGIYSFREPPERDRHFFDTCTKALGNVGRMLRPGAVGGDVTRTVEATFRDEGWNITGRALWDGHLIGLNVIRPPFGLIDNSDRFKAGMVFNVHPGLVVDDDQMGMFVQDNLIVTADGGRPVSAYEYVWHIV
jgi:Xaa-Pro aminopeptidase